jgi:hypothetical protein
MASLDQVVQQIRFGLEQLRSKNAHHEFEHLCRHYARALICSNILPATGPVSAGGDQGRDFETFRTYLAQSPIADGAFLGRVASEPVAFACAMHTKGVEGKIRADIETILASGTKVLSVHYFCLGDMAVAKRHRLQAWARDNHRLELEIHDGRAIAENLAQKAVFWIAVRYLAIPSEIYPRDLCPANDVYESGREKWRDSAVDVNSFPELQEIKGFLRHATCDPDVKQDIPFWIERLQRVVNSSQVQSLARRARYEIAVATLRGLGTLVGYEHEVRHYFAAPPSVDAFDELEDYTVLLSYCTTATVLGHAGFGVCELREWQTILVHRLEAAIAERTFPSTQAELLKLRGLAAMHRIGAESVALGFDETAELWSKALDLLPQAPLFPLEQFADMLTVICEWAGGHPRYNELTGRVDEALAKRMGGFTAAEKCRDRALAHHKNARVLDAISEIHKAKLNWFAEETLHGFILSLQVLSRWYTELGLCLAGKYYALAAASIALRSPKAEIKARAWRALLEAASSEYRSGAWAGFLELTELALQCHHGFCPDAGNLSLHADLETVFFHGAMAIAISERLSPALATFVKAKVDGWNLGELFEEPLAVARSTISQTPTEKFIASVEEQFVGMPINDVGVSRRVTWAAVGIEWSVEWMNDYETTAFAEQFVATFQVILAEIARSDLCLPQSSVEILFTLHTVSEPEVDPMLSPGRIRWRVGWPKHGGQVELDKVSAGVLATAITLLRGVSLSPNERVQGIVEGLFRSGIPGKTIVGQPYATLYRETLSERDFNRGRAVLAVPDLPGRSSPVMPHDELRARTGPGPGYSTNESQRQIATRYQRMAGVLQVTLQRLRQSPDFRTTVQRLRQKGWRDWHILGAIFASVLNYRSHQKYGPHAAYEEFAAEFLETPEEPDSPEVPASEFTQERLDFYRRFNTAAILKTWGLEVHHPALSPEVIEEFLATRYGYWTDDVEHEDLFGV